MRDAVNFFRMFYIDIFKFTHRISELVHNGFNLTLHYSCCFSLGQSRRRSVPLTTPLPSSPNDRRLEQHNAVNSMTEISHKSHLVHQVLHSPHFHSNSVHLTLPPPCLKKKTKGLQRELQKNKSREVPEPNPHLVCFCLT